MDYPPIRVLVLVPLSVIGEEEGGGAVSQFDIQVCLLKFGVKNDDQINFV